VVELPGFRVLDLTFLMSCPSRGDSTAVTYKGNKAGEQCVVCTAALRVWYFRTVWVLAYHLTCRQPPLAKGTTASDGRPIVHENHARSRAGTPPLVTKEN